MRGLLTGVTHQLSTGDVVLWLVFALMGSWLGYKVVTLFWPTARVRARERLAQCASQLGLALALEQAYEVTRGQIPHRQVVALTNAYRLLDLEWRHGFFVENRVEQFFLHFSAVMNAVDVFYVLSHVVVTIGVLAWIYLGRNEYYPFMRNMLLISTGVALIAFYVFPTAPPRFLPQYGFQDPLQLQHFVSAGGAQPDSYTYNPYAAMPSLHVAYSLVVAWTVFLAERRLLVRSLACVYPLLMSAAVVISGNHWLLDVAGAFVTVAFAGAAAWASGSLYHLLVGSLRTRALSLK